MKKKITTVLILTFLFSGLAGFTSVAQAAVNNQQYRVVMMPINNPPEIPDKPQGPTGFKVGQEQVYTTTTTDPDGHDVAYMWDFGDGTITDWSWTKPSGATSWPAEHTWTEEGSYEVKVKAKDDPNGDGDPSDGLESDWSEPLTITVQKKKVVNQYFILEGYSRIILN